LHDLLFAPFFCGAAGTGQSWHWDFYVEKNDIWWQLGRFKEALGSFDPIRENAQPFFEEMPNRLKLYGLRGQKTTLIWVRDGENNWRTELLDGKSPRKVSREKIALKGQKAKKVTCYDPWQNNWQTVKLGPRGKLILPDFSRSVVLKIEH
jgi:hypothetical protein